MSTIPLDQFAHNCGKPIETIQRNYQKIPDKTKTNNRFVVLSGTRYPFSLGNYKIDTSAEKRRVMLIAISRYEYIDCYKLRIEHRQFKKMLLDLLNAGLLEENGLSNHYGANAYDCTKLGAQIANEKGKDRWETINRISNMVASAAEHFTGAVISEIANA